MARGHGDLYLSKSAFPVGRFSKGLGIIAGEYLDYSEALATELKQNAGPYNCPQECPNETPKIDLNRTQKCQQCPREKHWKTFKLDTIERWEDWLGDQVTDFDFNDMLQTLYRVMDLEEIGKQRLSLFNSSLLRTFLEERRKADARR